jgi:class 3 adenylate cyclase/tetratricopeptide (TPR) repeat protein
MSQSGEETLAELKTVRRAVLVVDLVESVRLMQANEGRVIERWRRFVAAARAQVLPAHAGRLVKHLGDGMLIEWEHVPAALAAAFDLHDLMDRLNREHPGEALLLRAGIHVGQVQEDELDLYGQNVNLAARLATLAQPGSVVVSAEARDELVTGLDADFEDLGECWLKNLAQPVRALRASKVTTGVAALARRAPAVPAHSLRPRLAVLDLDVAGEDSALGSLLADELGGLITVNGNVELVSRMSTRRGAGSGRRRMVLLRHVQAAYGLTGSCTRLSDGVHLTLELLSVAKNETVWSDALACALADLVAAPADVMRSLCAKALAALSAHETRRARMLPIASLESYALLLGGITLMHRLSLSAFSRGQELLEAVRERVPRHPDAYAWLAKSHILRVHQGWSEDPHQSASRADDAARRALDLDGDCSLALTMAGMVQVYFKRDLDQGDRLYREALAANPNDALAWLLKGTLHGFRGEGPQALADSRRALALSPIDPLHYYFDALAASAAVSADEYGEAIDLAQRSLRANSLHASTWRVLAIAHSMRGDMQAARAAVERMMLIEPGFTVRRFVERSPGADFQIGRRFAQALRDAGVPEGSARAGGADER